MSSVSMVEALAESIELRSLGKTPPPPTYKKVATPPNPYTGLQKLVYLCEHGGVTFNILSHTCGQLDMCVTNRYGYGQICTSYLKSTCRDEDIYHYNVNDYVEDSYDWEDELDNPNCMFTSMDAVFDGVHGEYGVHGEFIMPFSPVRPSVMIPRLAEETSEMILSHILYKPLPRN